MRYLILTLLLIGCTESKLESDHEQNKIIGTLITYGGGNNNSREIYVYELDSCEYIGVVTGYYSDILTHKGNCKFCRQRNHGNKGNR